MSQWAALSRDPNGTVRAIWYDSRSTDWRWKVFTATLDSKNGWSEAQQVTTRGNNTASLELKKVELQPSRAFCVLC
ncbi:heme oxygenase [Streptomyces atratus]|uniref:hypothetical protein n=1 Tax=Streptomyces atratus TaxID=1893 RepID=UPI00339B13FE